MGTTLFFDIESGVLKGYEGPGGDVVIPAGVTSIGKHAFKGCDHLCSLIIPEGVTKIGAGAFKGCRLLASASFPGSIISIGEKAFEECINLRNVICFTPNVVSCINKPDGMHLIYLGEPFSGLNWWDSIRAVQGFFYAQEHGIIEINRWKEKYLEFIRAHIWIFMKDAKENEFILLFLIREGLLDRERTRNLLEYFGSTNDVKAQSALLQYLHEKFGTEDTGDFNL